MPDVGCWKAVERRLAKRLNGRRLGCTGRSGPDVLTPWLACEVKTRKRLPRWLLEALEQAAIGNDGSRLPIVVLHELNSRHDQDLVVMTLRDFCDWFGDLDGEDAGLVPDAAS